MESSFTVSIIIVVSIRRFFALKGVVRNVVQTDYRLVRILDDQVLAILLLPMNAKNEQFNKVLKVDFTNKLFQHT